MERIKLWLLTLFCLAVTGCENKEDAGPDISLETKQARMSYLLGYRDLEKFQNEGLSIDVEAFILGAQDAIEGVDATVSSEEGQELIAHFKAVLEEERMSKASENLQRSITFLEKNASKNGVITTESGLQYKIIRKGEGASPKPENPYYLTDFESRLVTGEMIDSSYAQGMKRNFGWNRVTEGWEEAMQLMKEGGKYEFYIPPELGYGTEGFGKIGPNEVLIVTIELYDADYQPE